MDIQFTSSSLTGAGAFAHLNAVPGLTREALIDFLDAMPVPLALVNLECGYSTLLNRAFCEAFHWERTFITDWTALADQIIDPEQREEVRQRWRTQAASAAASTLDAPFPVKQIEILMRGGDGAECTVLHSGVVLPAMRCAIGVYVDITVGKADEMRLAKAEQDARERDILYPVLLQLTHEMIVLTGKDGQRTFVSPAVLPLTGWSREEFLTQRTEKSVHPADLAEVLATRKRCLAGSSNERVRYRTLKKDGAWLWVEAAAACYRDPQTGSPLGYVATVRDSTEQQAEDAKRAEREALLEQQARFDQLTHVANRHVFYTALSDEARRQTRRTQSLSLLLVDIDHFKLFNDRYGHLEGDRVLRQVADILRRTASRIADLVARFGGEEFVLLLPMTDSDGAKAIAGKILSSMHAEAIPHLDSPSGFLTVSIGVAWWPASTAMDRDSLLLSADKALYAAKKQGRDRYAIDASGSAGLKESSLSSQTGWTS